MRRGVVYGQGSVSRRCQRGNELRPPGLARRVEDTLECKSTAGRREHLQLGWTCHPHTGLQGVCKLRDVFDPDS